MEQRGDQVLLRTFRFNLRKTTRISAMALVQSWRESTFSEEDLKRLEESMGTLGDGTEGVPDVVQYSPSMREFWPQMPQKFPEYIMVASIEGELAASGYAIPFVLEDELPAGWDEVVKKGFAD